MLCPEEDNQAGAPSDGVAQPPSAVPSQAKASKHHYWRFLPHFQGHGGAIFVTFNTINRWILPEPARQKTLDHCIHDHGKKIDLICAVVMPDHVHMIYRPRYDADGNQYCLAEILSGIKGSSAHSINRMLKRKGPVWQDESFDHILRSSESLLEKIDYIQQNPVRRGICCQPDEYPWFWHDGIIRSTAEGGCATP